MRRLACMLIVAAFLVGCTTSWRHPSIVTQAQHDYYFTIHKGYCTQMMAGAISPPSAPILTQPQPSYSYQGTVNQYGAPPAYYSGYAAPVANPGASFATGVANGLAIGAYANAKKEREAIFDGCMTQLGWIKE